MKRRTFIAYGLALCASVATAPLRRDEAHAQHSKKKGSTMPEKNWNLTEKEWRQRLTEEQFKVLRQAKTERAFTSPLNNEKRAGVYHCAGCDLALYDAAHKFDSGTGWPSFYQPITPSSVGTKTDYKLIWPREEVHCSRCKGHLGHVFEDGPKPTGLRYCMNGVAMIFKPA